MEDELKAYFENLVTEEYKLPGFRVLATSGPADFKYPFSFRHYYDLEAARKSVAYLEKKAFQTKIQSKVQDMWLDSDTDQTTSQH